MGEKGNERAADGTGTQPGSSASGTSTAGPGTGTGIGTGTGTGPASSGGGGGGGGSAATQERKPLYDDGWTYASGTPPPGYEGLTPQEEIAELEEGISNLNRNGQNAYDRGNADFGEYWERAGEMRKRQNQLQRELGLPESRPPGSSPPQL